MNAGIYMEGAFVMHVSCHVLWPCSWFQKHWRQRKEWFSCMIIAESLCCFAVLHADKQLRREEWKVSSFFLNLTRGCSPQRLTVEAPAVVAKGQLNRQHFENMSTTLPATADSQEKATLGFALKSKRFDFCILQKTSVAQRDGSFQPRLVVMSPISLLRLTQF